MSIKQLRITPLLLPPLARLACLSIGMQSTTLKADTSLGAPGVGGGGGVRVTHDKKVYTVRLCPDAQTLTMF